MTTFTRRHFLQLLGVATALTATPKVLRAQLAPPRVVVVGGGFAGATVAKYLRHWGGAVDVTLVEMNPSHVSCILSNLVVTGGLGLSRITFGYAALQARGVKRVQGQVLEVDSVTRKVRLNGNRTLDYDHLILAPGVAFEPVPGWDASQVPHAWIAGPQTTLLQRQLAAMPKGGTFVMTIPPAPYRCPPGPYERACLVADYLKRRKPGSKVIVLDANPDIVAEKKTFQRAFTQTYAGMLEYYPGVMLNEVDSKRRIARTSRGDFQATVLNIIPRQKAGRIVFQAGLVRPAERWAAVNPLNYESIVLPGHGIHVIGDAQGTGQPKSGHIANAEAKVCADALLRHFAGEPPYPRPVTNSACYSPITATTASWLTAVFAYDPASGLMKSVPAAAGEAPAPNGDHFEKMFAWADNLFADTFA
jgi:NADPH-dependent 2,4-dienoyl-CoA reductase/sulfur reductase-like enzyme